MIEPRLTIPREAARPLRRGGWFAVCPIHGGDLGALGLYPDLPRPQFHCFGCGEHGSFEHNPDGSFTLHPDTP